MIKLADAAIPGLDSINVIGAIDGVTAAVLWILGIAIVGGIVWLITYRMQFRIRAQVQEAVSGATIVRFDKIRAFKDRDGVPKWQFWGSLFKFKKDKTDIPGHEFISFTSKGQKFVNVLKKPSGEYIYMRSNANKADHYAEYDEFTTTERSNLVNELREAENYLPKDWTQTALQITIVMVPVIIITVFLIFFNNAVAPTIALGQQNVDVAQKMIDVQVKQQDTINLLTKIVSDLDPEYLKQLNEAKIMNATSVKVPN